MKTPLLPAGFGLLLLAILLSGCRKQNDIIAPTFTWKVVGTSPVKDEGAFSFYEEVTATLNSFIDTSLVSVSILISKDDSSITGSISITDSTAHFTATEELSPAAVYKARLVLTGIKEKTTLCLYEWSFKTKEAEAYVMTKRSDRVTDFDRDGTRSMQIGSYLYSFGGWAVPEESYSDVYRSSGDLSAWEKRPDAPWHGRHVYGIGKLANSTYIIGGDNLHNAFDVWRTTDGENWTLLSQNILGNRIYYGSAVHNGYLYIVGGSGYNDVWRSADGISWQQVTTNAGFLDGENFAGSLASFQGRLWMVCGGGTGGGSGTPRREVWSSEDGSSWRREKDFAGSERLYTDVCVWDNKLWVVGGYNYSESNIASIWYMTPKGAWKKLAVPPDYIGRHATGVAVYNNQLAITCGNYQNDCWVVEKTNQ